MAIREMSGTKEVIEWKCAELERAGYRYISKTPMDLGEGEFTHHLVKNLYDTCRSDEDGGMLPVYNLMLYWFAP